MVSEQRLEKMRKETKTNPFFSCDAETFLFLLKANENLRLQNAHLVQTICNTTGPDYLIVGGEDR